jgi:phosphoglycerate dehydrogenase-like enzyme
VSDLAFRMLVAPVNRWADSLLDPVRDGGAVPVRPADLVGDGPGGAEELEALLWVHPTDPGGLASLLERLPGLRWVQLPFAGVDSYADIIRAHADWTWTCAKGAYSRPVAEHALALALAGMRSLDRFARARTWGRQAGRNLVGAKVAVLGGGGITEALLAMLAPFDAEVTVVRSRPRAMAHAARVLGIEDTDAALTGAELVVLALPLLPSTVGVIDRRRLGLLAPGATLVNVARGPHVVTDDLVAALQDGTLGSAGLDVTDPEPLPDGHPLWSLPNAIVTPHTANTAAMAGPLLADRVRENIRRWLAGEPLLGRVDPARGY